MRKMCIISAGLLALSLPANAGEKVSGHSSDFQALSELSAAIPDKPGHSLKQVAFVWKNTGSSDVANHWVSAAEQQEVVGPNITTHGYGTSHFANGDVAYFVWDGADKVTPKEAGAFEMLGEGKFSWYGGTGTHNIKGPGTYTCKFTEAGGTCDWQSEIERGTM